MLTESNTLQCYYKNLFMNETQQWSQHIQKWETKHSKHGQILLEIRVTQNLMKLGGGCTTGRNFGGVSICV